MLNTTMRMCIVSIGLLATGTACAGSDMERSGGGPASRATEGCLPADSARSQKDRLDELLGIRQARARRLKARDVAANRRVLEEVPVFPGSRLIGTGSGPFENRRLPHEGEEKLFDDYASCVLDADHYLELIATGWTSTREYVLPVGVKARTIRTLFVARLTPNWRFLDEERYPGSPALRESGVGAYALHLTRGGRCLWVHIGDKIGHGFDGDRGITIGTSRRAGIAC